MIPCFIKAAQSFMDLVAVFIFYYDSLALSQIHSYAFLKHVLSYIHWDE